jgi:hypothetical protein
MVILALLGNISQETSPRAEGTARLSRYWIKREQAVLAQEASPRKTENRSFFPQVLSIAVELVVKDIVPAPKPQGNITSGSHLQWLAVDCSKVSPSSG